MFDDPAGAAVHPATRLATTGAGAHLVTVGPAVPLTGAHVFQRFAATFAGKRPVTALTPPGFDEDETLPATAAALLELQAEQLVEAVGDAPFALLGVSSGGILACELGRLLAGRGRPPSGVVLLDTYTMRDPRLDHLQPHLLTAMGSRQDVVRVDRARLTAFAWTCDLFRDWRLTPAEFPTLLARAGEPLPGLPPDTPWQTEPGPATTVVDLSGAHFTMLEQHVDATAAIVEQWLTEREETA